TSAKDDYKELLELYVIFLGGYPKREVTFLKPGAISSARFMSKAIFMFSSQLNLTKTEIDKLQLITLFIFKDTFKKIGDPIYRKAEHHTNYLSEDLSGLSFFDERISIAEKRLKVQGLKNISDWLRNHIK
uniref:Uncharacterized protein n=1 Tax=Megaselia scalaris TaxID=36166 RepID=T1GDI7_MEGSC